MRGTRAGTGLGAGGALRVALLESVGVERTGRRLLGGGARRFVNYCMYIHMAQRGTLPVGEGAVLPVFFVSLVLAAGIVSLMPSLPQCGCAAVPYGCERPANPGA